MTREYVSGRFGPVAYDDETFLPVGETGTIFPAATPNMFIYIPSPEKRRIGSVAHREREPELTLSGTLRSVIGSLKDISGQFLRMTLTGALIRWQDLMDSRLAKVGV